MALRRTVLAAKRTLRSSWGRALQVVPCPASALRLAGTNLFRTCSNIIYKQERLRELTLTQRLMISSVIVSTRLLADLFLFCVKMTNTYKRALITVAGACVCTAMGGHHVIRKTLLLLVCLPSICLCQEQLSSMHCELFSIAT